MSIYLKPQSPLYYKKDDSYFYPLTTSDQVLFDNKKLTDCSIVNIKEIPFVLLKNKWFIKDGVYVQYIYVEGLNESYNVDVTLTYTDDLDTDLLISKNASYIKYAKQDNDKITFYCLKSKPNIDIPIEVEVGL